VRPSALLLLLLLLLQVAYSDGREEKPAWLTAALHLRKMCCMM
jgi:hypothetical protein